MNGFSPVRMTRFGSAAMGGAFLRRDWLLADGRAGRAPALHIQIASCEGGASPLMLPARQCRPEETPPMSIELWTWNTPNGRKISVALEEMGLSYTVKPVNIGKGEQFKPEFLKISPNNRIPAIIDSDGPDGQPISIFESGAILIYL